tara:strand:- start:2335 stop:3369 length:1035 start_codon:yes stop_codon:yes gene_type:complete
MPIKVTVRTLAGGGGHSSIIVEDAENSSNKMYLSWTKAGFEFFDGAHKGFASRERFEVTFEESMKYEQFKTSPEMKALMELFELSQKRREENEKRKVAEKSLQDKGVEDGNERKMVQGEEAINIEEVFDGSVIKRGEIVDSDFDMIEEVKPIVEAQNAELEYKQKIETKIRDSQLTYSKSQNNCAHIVARILGVINPSILPENKKAELFLLPGEVFDNSIKHKLGKLHEQRTELLKDVNSNIKLLIKNTQEAIKDELSMVKARKSCAFRGFFSFDSFNIEAREKKLKTLDKLLTNIEKNPDQIKVHLKNASKDLSGITKKEIEQLISIMDNKPSPSVPSRANII